jgi:hypothetical protein
MSSLGISQTERNSKMIVPICDCPCVAPVAAVSSSFPWPTAIPAFVSAITAVLVAIVAYQQWRTAQHKLRLDLYNRRLAIYTATVTYAAELQNWSASAAQYETHLSWIMVTGEVPFLFDPKSGIADLIGELRNFGIEIRHIDRASLAAYQQFDGRPISPEMDGQLEYKKWRASVKGLNSAFEALTVAMMPYLNFHNIR